MTDQPTVVPGTLVPGTLAQMLQAQLKWQQLMWQLPLAMWGGGWLTAARARQAAVGSADCAAHAQLAVPGDLAEAADNALFA